MKGKSHGLNQSRGSKGRKCHTVKGFTPRCRHWGGKNDMPANARILLKSDLRRRIEDAFSE